MLAAIGATIPAAVIIETVADPVAIRISAAIPHPNNIGEICDSFAISAIVVPIPESNNTLLNAPPAPITNNMFAIGPRQSFVNCNTLSFEKPFAYPRLKKE
ncbi:Uncharacterised protein [Streptococcus pneumoniae]|nr:Uncharacterised protein [Streptococcus pneumoniae]COT51384.1 Uncharacterised protein [Streptococcus pneumoniae]